MPVQQSEAGEKARVAERINPTLLWLLLSGAVTNGQEVSQLLLDAPETVCVNGQPLLPGIFPDSNVQMVDIGNARSAGLSMQSPQFGEVALDPVRIEIPIFDSGEFQVHMNDLEDQITQLEGQQDVESDQEPDEQVIFEVPDRPQKVETIHTPQGDIAEILGISKTEFTLQPIEEKDQSLLFNDGGPFVVTVTPVVARPKRDLFEQPVQTERQFVRPVVTKQHAIQTVTRIAEGSLSVAGGVAEFGRRLAKFISTSIYDAEAENRRLTEEREQRRAGLFDPLLIQISVRPDVTEEELTASSQEMIQQINLFNAIQRVVVIRGIDAFSQQAVARYAQAVLRDESLGDVEYPYLTEQTEVLFNTKVTEAAMAQQLAKQSVESLFNAQWNDYILQRKEPVLSPQAFALMGWAVKHMLTGIDMNHGQIGDIVGADDVDRLAKSAGIQ